MNTFLKRLLIILAIVALGLLVYSVFVENIFSPRLSPKDSAKISLNDLTIVRKLINKLSQDDPKDHKMLPE